MGISTIVFRPVDCVIPKLEVYGFDSNGKKDGVIESFSDLTPRMRFVFDLREQSVYHNIKYDGILNTGNMQNMYLAIISEMASIQWMALSII